ncbi:arrestin domain-containing protein 2-like [Bombyx mandarina]|uniref:Arrestin domain-containing protein 2-like n=1 Tax=Bombyx mandarina TaxID=7092 RepID=A0A6J2JDR9_BOMMA|nr:arrestin domain-containing protein 2-like [Bombyx mandarina]
MTWDNCIIRLNSDSTGSFYTGDIVTGTVILEFDQEQKIERIDLHVIGISKAQWTRSMPTMPYIKIYSEKKKILSISICDIFSEIISGKKIRPGIYTYPFHFALPLDLPSSFESKIAKVHYCIKIKSKPAVKVRKNVPLRILENVNLNHLEEMMITSIHDFVKAFRTSGKFSVSVKTYRAFASKQTVPFEIILNNSRKVKISKLTVALIQKLRYEVQTGYAEEEKTMCKAENKKFANALVEICNLKIEMPSLSPSTIHSLGAMVNISYEFRVKVKFRFHFSLIGSIPVTVATVPVIHHDF